MIHIRGCSWPACKRVVSSFIYTDRLVCFHTSAKPLRVEGRAHFSLISRLLYSVLLFLEISICKTDSGYGPA